MFIFNIKYYSNPFFYLSPPAVLANIFPYASSTMDYQDIKETLALKQRLNNIYVKHTGQKLPVVEKSMERDNFMSPEKAKDFGIVDKVIEIGLLANVTVVETGAEWSRRLLIQLDSFKLTLVISISLRHISSLLPLNFL